mgnify:CR=1 FL=1
MIRKSLLGRLTTVLLFARVSEATCDRGDILIREEANEAEAKLLSEAELYKQAVERISNLR